MGSGFHCLAQPQPYILPPPRTRRTPGSPPAAPLCLLPPASLPACLPRRACFPACLPPPLPTLPLRLPALTFFWRQRVFLLRLCLLQFGLVKFLDLSHVWFVGHVGRWLCAHKGNSPLPPARAPQSPRPDPRAAEAPRPAAPNAGSRKLNARRQ